MEVTQAMWDDLSHRLTEARDFAKAANEKAAEARDSSVQNGVVLEQVVKPKLTKVDEHETAIQKTRGALWALGIVGSILALGLAALPFVIR